jgi:hypothetical protein
LLRRIEFGTDPLYLAPVLGFLDPSPAHMAEDHRYYKRFNFQSVPMEHYEVEDVMHRRTASDVHVFIESHLQQIQQQPRAGHGAPAGPQMYASVAMSIAQRTSR